MKSFNQGEESLTSDKPWTLKEMTQTISELKKDNFNLQLRIYYLEYEGGSQKCSNTELTRCREELEKMEALFHQEKMHRLQLEDELQVYRLQDPPFQEPRQSEGTRQKEIQSLQEQNQELFFILEARDRHIEKLQVVVKAQDTIIKQLRTSRTNQGSGDHPSPALTHFYTITAQREDDIQDLKDLLELKDFELLETRINQEASTSDLQQALQEKESELLSANGLLCTNKVSMQKLHDLLNGCIQDQAERDATLTERDATLTERDATLTERDATLAERDATLAERDATLAERDATLAERDAMLTERDATLAERDATLAERDATLAESRSKLKDLEANVNKLTQLLEDTHQELQLMSGQLNESARERELLEQSLKESFTHSTHQSQALEQRLLEVLTLKGNLEESVWRNQDLYRRLQASEQAFGKKHHSGWDRTSEQSSCKPAIGPSACHSEDTAPRCPSSPVPGHGLRILVPREIYDTLLEHVDEGLSLISHVRRLLQQCLQTQDQRYTHIHFFYHENLKLKSELMKLNKEKSLHKKMLSEAVKRLRQVNRRNTLDLHLP